MFRIYWIPCLIALSVSGQCANILGIFLFPFLSHNVFHESYIATLLERGHKITVLSAYPQHLESHQNLSYIYFDEAKELQDFVVHITYKRSYFPFIMEMIWRLKFSEMFDKFLENPNTQHLIQNGKKGDFDLIIHEFQSFNSFMAFSELFGCPVILAISCEASVAIHSIMGNEINPLVIPDIWSFPYYLQDMTLLKRIQSIIYAAGVHLIGIPLVNLIMNHQIKKHFPNATATQKEIENRISLLMLNTLPELGYVRETQNTIQVGFLPIKPPRPIEKGALKDFMDASENGVIYMSFGTIGKVSDLNPRELKVFLNVFAKLNYSVVLKYETNNLDEFPPNVFVSNWIPQNDLLAHPKTKVFITHAGMSSVQESISRKVPMILFPLYGDQYYNAYSMEKKKIGISLDLNTITEDQLADSIETVQTPEYQKSIENLYNIINDRQISSLNLAIWSIENVLKHNTTLVNPNRGYKGLLYRKYYLDVIAVFLSVAYISHQFLNAF